MKNSLFKRIAAVAFAAATILTCAPTSAMAAAPNSGSVTVTKYQGESNQQGYEELSPEFGGEQTVQGKELLSNVEFAYAEVGSRVQIDTTKGTEMLYTLSTGVDTILGSPSADYTKDNVNYYSQQTLQNALNTKKDEAIAYVKANKGNTAEKTAVTTGQAKFENLSLEKLYLFAETDATDAKDVTGTNHVDVTQVSVPFLVSLPFTGKDGNLLYDLHVYPKNATGIEKIDKNIIVDTSKKKETTANIGDKIKYEVTYSVPVKEHGLQSLEIVDVMSKGLTFDGTVVVKNGDIVVAKTEPKTQSENYELTVSSTPGKETTITINFTESYLQTLPVSSTQSFTVAYSATVNKDAVLGQNGNTNKVKVNYQNKEDKQHTTPEVTTKVFAYGIDLLKNGEGKDTVLTDVEFTLTKGVDAETAVPVKVISIKDSSQPENTFYVTGNGATENKVVSNGEGKINIRGLEPGTYFLTETKTKAGYVLLKDPVKIVITQTNAQTGEAKATVNGTAVEMTNDEINVNSLTAKIPVTVVNHKGFDLPATGGAGTTLFTIAGIVIVAVAGALLLMRRKTNK